MFRGLPWAPPNTLKLFSAKCFIIFFSRLWKIHLLSFQDFLHKNLLVSSSNVIFHYNTVKIEYNDGLFLDVNEKKTFFGKMFYYFFLHAYETYTCHHFKIFFTKICWYYLAMWFFTIIHFKLSVTKDFFLMWIKKDLF